MHSQNADSRRKRHTSPHRRRPGVKHGQNQKSPGQWLEFLNPNSAFVAESAPHRKPRHSVGRHQSDSTFTLPRGSVRAIGNCDSRSQLRMTINSLGNTELALDCQEVEIAGENAKACLDDLSGISFVAHGHVAEREI